MKSKTEVLFPIWGCLNEIGKFIGKPNIDWVSNNHTQDEFLKRFSHMSGLVDQIGNNLKSKADVQVSVINTWLRDNGFNIQLDETRGAEFAVASILNILVEWCIPGKEIQMLTKSGIISAVHIKDNCSGNISQYKESSQNPNPIVRLDTKNHDRVFITKVGDYDDDNFVVSQLVDMAVKNIKLTRLEECEAVKFPMVDYDQETDISWIEGMAVGPNDNDYFIGQAMQQTQFRMNEKGARAKSACAMMTKRGIMADSTVVIDEPFLLWIQRKGISEPLFSGVFAEDSWGKPVEL